jgi:hypothetical protein
MGTWKGTLGVLVALANGCVSFGESSTEPVPPSDAPLRVVGAARSDVSPSIEVEKVGDEFLIRNATHSHITCGAVHALGWSPRQTVQVAALGSARIVEPIRNIVVCEADLKAAAEMAGESEDELRRSLGASASEKLLFIEDRGAVSSSTVMLASSCKSEPLDHEGAANEDGRARGRDER